MSYQEDATARPKTPFKTDNPGDHTHPNGTGSQVNSDGSPNWKSGFDKAYTGGAGSHTHYITEGGDTEEAEIQFSVEMSNCIKKGILTKGMLVKKYSDTGGIFSEDDDKRLTAMYIDIAKLQREYVVLENGTAEQKQKAEVVLEKLAATRKEMVDLESTYLNLFNNTADVIAQNNIIRWFCINLAHKQEGGGKIEPLFTGSTYEQKLENMRDLDEAEDPLYQAAFRKLATFVSYWYFSKNATKEDFKKLEKDIEEGKY